MKHFVIAMVNTEHDESHPTIKFVDAENEAEAVRQALADFHHSMYGEDPPMMEGDPYDCSSRELWAWDAVEAHPLYAATIVELPK